MARSKYKTRRVKRPYRKRRYLRRYRRNVTRISRAPITNSSIVRMRYCTPIQLQQQSAGVPVSYHFNANSIYDPDNTSTGHQPNGFDQWSAFYNHFHVIASKITVNFQAVGATAQLGAHIVGIGLRDTVGSLTTVSEITEQGNTAYKHITDNDSSRAAVTVTKTFSAKKFFNKKSIVDNSELRGQMGNLGTGANPSELAIFQVFAGHIDSAVVGDPLYAYVTIEYIAVLTEPKELLQS